MQITNQNRQDKVSADILELLARIESSQNDIRDEIKKNTQKIRNIQDTLEAPRQNGVEQESPSAHGDINVGTTRERESEVLSTTESPPHLPEMPVSNPLFYMPYGQDEDEEDSGDPGPPKPPSIPINHTTGAARLLLVPSIKEMCRGIFDKSPIIKNEKYPMYTEERRGLLRLYGRGEGTDAPLGHDMDPSIDHGSQSTLGDTSSNVSSPADESQWSQVSGGLTPPANVALRGDIGANGMPDFSRNTVTKFVISFKNNILNMHPLIAPRVLDRLVESFLQLTDDPGKPKMATSRSAAGFLKHQNSAGNKRKRSPNEYSNSPKVLRDLDFHPFRSISTALVLCVLALGSICREKGKVRDYVSDNITEREPDYIRSGLPQDRSRRTSVEGFAYPPKSLSSKAKNFDVIPRLPYFTLATDIIGNQLGGNTLQHIHVNILAGLYHGQLARVLESHAYISQACRAVQIVLRP